MYEMQGVLPGHAPPSGQLPGLPGLADRPLVPCIRGMYRFPEFSHVPGVAPGVVPVSIGEAFLLYRRMARKGLRQNSGKFFSIHTMSTEGGRLSAVIHGYPPVYAQPLHRLPEVTRRIRLGRGWPAFRAPLAPDRPSVDEAAGRA